MKKETVGIDIDGTLSEYDSFLPYLNQLLKTNVKKEQLIQYDLHEIFGLEYADFGAIFDEHSIPMYRESIPRACARAELQWMDKQFQIIYITARYQQYRDVTHEWLLEHGFPNREIICTGSHDKLQAIRDNNVKLMVEDRLENALEIWEQLRVPVYLLDTPYNQAKLPEGIWRVENWHQITNHLQMVKQIPYVKK